MFCRRALFARLRDAAVALTVPAFATSTAACAAATGKLKGSSDSGTDFHPMPFDNPPYGAPPLTFGERHGVTVIVKTDDDLIRSLLPRPLKPDGMTVMVQQQMNTITHPLAVEYPNGTIVIPAVLGELSGFYMARVYEGSENATMLTIWGREIWGFPKIAAKTDVKRKGDQTESYVRAGHASADVASLCGATQSWSQQAHSHSFAAKRFPRLTIAVQI